MLWMTPVLSCGSQPKTKQSRHSKREAWVYINNNGRHIMWGYLGSKSPADEDHLRILLSMSLKWAVSIRPSKLKFTKYFSLHRRFLLTAWPPGNSCGWPSLQHVFKEKKMIFSFQRVPSLPFSRILYCIHLFSHKCYKTGTFSFTSAANWALKGLLTCPRSCCVEGFQSHLGSTS